MHPIPKNEKAARETRDADAAAREWAERCEIERKLHEYGMALARAEGRLEGKQSGLLILLTSKFGDVPSVVQSRVAAATEVEVDLWSDRVLDAETLEAVFAAENDWAP